MLVLLVDRFGDLAFREFLDALLKPRGNLGLNPFHFLRPIDLLEQLVLRRHELLDATLGNRECLGDVLLGHLECATLDHDDRLVVPGDDEIHVAELELLEGGIQHPVSLESADTDARQRARKRDLRRVQRKRCRDDREHVGVILLIRGDDEDVDLHFVLEPLGEHGTDRTVDDSRRQYFAVARPALTFDEAAGDLAGRVRLLAVFDEERKEWERTLRLAHGYCGEHHRVAELHQGGPCRLLRHAARFDHELATGERRLNALHRLSYVIAFRSRREAGSSLLPNGLSRNAKRAGRNQCARASVSCRLVTEPQLLNQLAVRLDIGPPQVVQQSAALTHHLEEAAATVVILAVFTKVLGEVINALCQDCDLNSR